MIGSYFIIANNQRKGSIIKHNYEIAKATLYFKPIIAFVKLDFE